MSSVNEVIFMKKPTIYHATGLILTGSNLPNPECLVSELLQDIFVTWNRPYPHRCTKMCRQMAQIFIGYPRTEDVKSSCSDRCEKAVRLFEHRITNELESLDQGEKEILEIQSIIIRFFPCVNYLEVVDAAIYL